MKRRKKRMEEEEKNSKRRRKRSMKMKIHPPYPLLPSKQLASLSLCPEILTV